MVAAETDWPRTIAHADMDAFYAAIEQLDDPSLRGRPVLVGPRGGRGVVLTASYEARPFRVGSAMPMAKARRLCPTAIIVPPRFERYKDVSRTIMNVFSDFSPTIEAISLDEAFIDLTGTSLLLGNYYDVGRKLKEAVREATGGLTVSVGISSTKHVAKVASAFQKPDGLTIVKHGEAKVWLAPLPVSRLWGVGPKTEARLHERRLYTIGDVASCNPDWLTRELGNVGQHLYSLANGQDARAVEGRKRSRSIASERTLERDVYDKADIERHLKRAADDVAKRLRGKGFVAFGVTVKLKTREFKVLSRQHRRQQPTDVAEELYNDAALILDKFECRGPFRLVGLGVYDLIARNEISQMDLFSSGGQRRKLEVAIDSLKERFGSDVVRRGDDIESGYEPPNLDFLSGDDDFDDA